MDLLLLHCSLRPLPATLHHIFTEDAVAVYGDCFLSQTLHIRHDPSQMRHFPSLGARSSVTPVLRLAAGQAQSLVRRELVNARIDAGADGDTIRADASARLNKFERQRHVVAARRGFTSGQCLLYSS